MSRSRSSWHRQRGHARASPHRQLFIEPSVRHALHRTISEDALALHRAVSSSSNHQLDTLFTAPSVRTRSRFTAPSALCRAVGQTRSSPHRQLGAQRHGCAGFASKSTPPVTSVRPPGPWFRYVFRRAAETLIAHFMGPLGGNWLDTGMTDASKIGCCDPVRVLFCETLNASGRCYVPLFEHRIISIPYEDCLGKRKTK